MESTPKIVVFTEGDKIRVNATVSTQGPRDKEIRLTVVEIERYLQEQNIKYSKCIKADVLTNGKKSKKVAEWVFEKPRKTSKKIKVDSQADSTVKEEVKSSGGETTEAKPTVTKKKRKVSKRKVSKIKTTVEEQKE